MKFLCLFQTQWKHTKCKIRKCWYGTDLRLVLVVQQLKRWPINRSLVITDFCPTMTLAIACSAITQHFTQCTALFVKGWSTSWWQGLWISVAEILPQMPPPPNCQHQLSPEVTNPTKQLKKKSKIRFHELGGMIPTVTFYSPPPPLYSHKWHGVIWHPAESNCHIGCSHPRYWPLRHLSSHSMLICSKKYLCNRCTLSALYGLFLQVIVKVAVIVKLCWSTRKWEK